MKDLLRHAKGVNSGNGTDAYGFTVLPAGGLDSNGTSFDLGHNADFWSSSEIGASNAWYRNFYYSSANVDRYNDSKSRGFSLRCIQN